MSIYIRAYEDYSFELIYIEGTIKRKRIHLYVNPSKYAKLVGQKSKLRTEVNPESLTHIVCIETYIVDPNLVERTFRLAQLTNKPVITNESTAVILKQKGLSVKQLRIIGFEEEVVENLRIDPVYVEELSSITKNDSEPQITKQEDDKPLVIQFSENIIKTLNPLNWKPFQKITERVLPDLSEKIDPKNPLAFELKFGKKMNLLIPSDQRALDHLDQIITDTLPHTLVIVNQELNYTKSLPKGISRAILLNGYQRSEEVTDLEIFHIPKTHNPGVYHDTLYGPLEQWIDIE